MKTFVVAAVSLAFASAIPAATSAEAPQQKRQAPGFYRMMVGDFEVTALSDGLADQPMDKLLTRIEPAELDRLARKRFLTFPAIFVILLTPAVFHVMAALGDSSAP